MANPSSKTSSNSAAAKKTSVKSKATKSKAGSKESGVKKVTPYTTFMSTELPKVKKANPSISHQEAFKAAAENWASSPDNPKNSKSARS